MALTAECIARLSPEDVDRLFRSGEVGQIPDGVAEGLAIFRPGHPVQPLLAKLAHGVAWKGKVVNARKGELRNRVSALGLHAIAADVYPGRSWFDGGECIVLDYSKRSRVAHFVRDEIRRVAPGLYLGLVYLWKTRAMYFTLKFTA
ncbi:MAG: hypothetical protein DIU78_012580 [Pseudomonadota bacterium]|nr:MAG: hypothetical protein DIU78_11170 [Pseudomonadota bacterium]